MHNRIRHVFRAFPALLLFILVLTVSLLFTGCSDGGQTQAGSNANGSVSAGTNVSDNSNTGSADGSGADSSNSDSSGQKRGDAYAALVPTASGDTCYGDDSSSIDASNISEGYVMVRYTGNSEKPSCR